MQKGEMFIDGANSTRNGSRGKPTGKTVKRPMTNRDKCAIIETALPLVGRSLPEKGTRVYRHPLNNLNISYKEVKS